MKKALLIVLLFLLSSVFYMPSLSVYASLVAEWTKTYGGTSSDSAQRVIQTLDGGYAVLGATQSFGAGGIDFWLVKTDRYGNMEWNQTYGGPNNDQPYC